MTARSGGPDFIGIGVQKCGTTWIGDILEQHPSVLFRRKEVNFFVRHFHRGYGWYHQWFVDRGERLAGEITPNYFALARTGVVFADHHAVYPTFTMMNSASIATGTYPGAHGFYGNVVYAPSASGKNAKGTEIDFSAPAFIEDFGVVEAVQRIGPNAAQDNATSNNKQQYSSFCYRRL